jgi:tetratricopeptide (TPR) repeat protein
VLLQRVPLPKLTAASFQGESRPLGSAGQGLHLINLWAAWCAPCMGELKAFGTRHAEIQQAGVTISALSVDGLVGDEDSNAAQALEVVQRLQLPFSTGVASKELLDKLDVVQDVVTTRKTTIDDAFSFAVPTSFLLDEGGRICVIYQGAVELDRLLADAALIRAGQLQATPFAGRWFLEPQDAPGILARFADRFLRRGYPAEAQRYAGLAAALASRRTSDLNATRLVSAVYNDLGNHFDRKRDSASAEANYLLALEANSQSPQAHNNLGDVYYRRGEFEAARTHFREALRHNPNLIQAHMNLAAIDFTQGKLDAAINGFRRALQIDPRFAVAHNYLGLALAKKGNYSDAGFHFSEAVRLDPSYSDAADNLRAMMERRP